MAPARIHAAGGIVLGENGTVAMVRHRNSTGAWLFPKGRTEEGESEEETARREIEEESGLTDLELIDDLGTYERYHIRPDGTEDRTEIKCIRMFLFAAPKGASTSPSMEMDGARWVPLKNVINESGNIADRAWFARVFPRIREAVQRD